MFVTNPGANHIAFRVDTLEQLRVFYTRAKRQGLPIPYALDSGVAIGFFVRDPEGNAVEIYLARPQPRGDRPPVSDPGLIDELILGSSQRPPRPRPRDSPAPARLLPANPTSRE